MLFFLFFFIRFVLIGLGVIRSLKLQLVPEIPVENLLKVFRTIRVYNSSLEDFSLAETPLSVKTAAAYLRIAESDTITLRTIGELCLVIFVCVMRKHKCLFLLCMYVFMFCVIFSKILIISGVSIHRVLNAIYRLNMYVCMSLNHSLCCPPSR